MSTQEASSIDLSHHFLIAMPAMDDPNFGGTVIYLVEHNARGALGLVINRTAEMDLKTLLERIELPSDRVIFADDPVFYGGPVQTDRGFVLHQPPGNWTSTLSVDQDTALTSSRDVLDALARGNGPERIMVLLGYAGWGPGQLEKELASNAWLTVKADPELLFGVPVEERFNRALGLLGVDPMSLSGAAGHA